MSVLDDWNEQRRIERADTITNDLADLQTSTIAINSGLSNPGLWLLLAAGLVAAPFTLGAGFGLSIYAAVKMSGGRHMVTDAKPRMADAAAPGWGCLRILSALLGLVLAIVAVGFVVMLVAFEMGAIG